MFLAWLLLGIGGPPRADAAACTPALAAPVAMRDLAAVPARHAGRCVTVSGPGLATLLYSGSFGVFMPIVVAASAAAESAGSDVITGFADSCARTLPMLRDRAAATGDGDPGDRVVIDDLLAHCGNGGGALLRVVHHELAPAPPSPASSAER